MTALDGVNGTVCNAEQYKLSLESYDSRTPSISCLTHGQSIGMAFAAECSFLSCVPVTVILIWVVWNVHWYKKNFPYGNWKLFRRPADIYMFSLFAFDLVQSIAGIFNIRWAHNGIVTTGSYCTLQAVVAQIGELGVSLITLFLAVHTFVAAIFQVGLKARGVAFSLVFLACVFITLWVAIGAGTHKNYATPTPYWCWVSPQFPAERLGGEYVWMWIALFASAILYIPLYFWAEGFWSVDEAYTFHWWNADRRVEYSQRRAALGMLLYPLTYSLIVLPLTVARWLHFTHHHVSSAASFFGTSVFHLSGAVNVLLFLIIRPELLLFPRPVQLDDSEPEIHLTIQEDAGAAMFYDTTIVQHSPEPTLAMSRDEYPRDSATTSRVSSIRILDDI